MCGLCGILGADSHWANKVEQNGQSANTPLRRQYRARRMLLLNTLLQKKHLTIHDWQGTYYTVVSATGKTKIVDDLSQIWLAVEELTGSAYDPLEH